MARYEKLMSFFVYGHVIDRVVHSMALTKFTFKASAWPINELKRLVSGFHVGLCGLGVTLVTFQKSFSFLFKLYITSKMKTKDSEKSVG